MRIFAFVLLASGGPTHAASDLDRAHALLDDWQLEDAQVLAEQILAATPDDPQAWLLAGRVLHHRGEHTAALMLFDAAGDVGARDSESARPLVESSARYQAHFETLDAEHFSIRYLNKDEIVASYAVEVLEAAYRNIAGDLRFLPAERGEKIVVEIYPDARGLAGATGLTVHEIETSGTIAVCKFHRLMITSPLATVAGYDWGDTLAHEFVHLVISKKSKNGVPIWLHEGIAKFYESRWKGKAGDSLLPYSEKLLAEAVRKKKLITFAEMHPSMAKLPSQEAAALAFAEVFTVVEYLSKTYGPEGVPKVLELVGKGVELERALKQTFGAGMAGIESKWKLYLAKRPFKEVASAGPRKIRLAADEQEAQKEEPLETIEDRVVHDFSRLGELLQLRGHTKAAVVEYEKAYARVGVRYASLGNRLARAYSGTGRDGDALALLDKLLAVHPDDADAHLAAGRLRYERHDQDAAAKHFRAVRLVNPFNPEIHIALSKLYEAQGDATLAAREKHFYELTRKPRPTRSYELPPPRAGAARMSIVAPGWRPVRINGGAQVATPAWRYAVDPGQYTIEYVKAGGAAALKTVSLGDGADELLLLP